MATKKRRTKVSLVISDDDTSPILTVTLHKVIPNDELRKYAAKAVAEVEQWLDVAREEQKLPIFNKAVGKLGLKSETVALLATGEISYIGELVQMTEEELWDTEGMEFHFQNEIEAALAKHGLTLGMTLGLWTRPTKPSSVGDL